MTTIYRQFMMSCGQKTLKMDLHYRLWSMIKNKKAMIGMKKDHYCVVNKYSASVKYYKVLYIHSVTSSYRT